MFKPVMLDVGGSIMDQMRIFIWQEIYVNMINFIAYFLDGINYLLYAIFHAMNSNPQLMDLIEKMNSIAPNLILAMGGGLILFSTATAKHERIKKYLKNFLIASIIISIPTSALPIVATMIDVTQDVVVSESDKPVEKNGGYYAPQIDYENPNVCIKDGKVYNTKGNKVTSGQELKLSLLNLMVTNPYSDKEVISCLDKTNMNEEYKGDGGDNMVKGNIVYKKYGNDFSGEGQGKDEYVYNMVNIILGAIVLLSILAVFIISGMKLLEDFIDLILIQIFTLISTYKVVFDGITALKIILKTVFDGCLEIVIRVFMFWIFPILMVLAVSVISKFHLNFLLATIVLLAFVAKMFTGSMKIQQLLGVNTSNDKPHSTAMMMAGGMMAGRVAGKIGKPLATKGLSAGKFLGSKIGAGSTTIGKGVLGENNINSLRSFKNNINDKLDHGKNAVKDKAEDFYNNGGLIGKFTGESQKNQMKKGHMKNNLNNLKMKEAKLDKLQKDKPTSRSFQKDRKINYKKEEIERKLSNLKDKINTKNK